ncbi:MAG: RagB/SusD family nutrient uptake outer membrane protein [Bacteroidia bacterium]|nr:RagB/SusD family nutrient uptake outer membrane protein [Bacteroidia bacterium]
MKIKNIIITLCFSLGLLSCNNYLDVSDELAGGLQNLDMVFSNVDYTKRYYANIFTGIPDYSGIVEGSNGLGNPWTGICDELYVHFGPGTYTLSDKNSETIPSSYHRWGDLYKLIRQTNIFLSRVKPIQESGTQAAQLLPDEVADMKANARFMRAFYHYLLFEQYGSIQLVKDSVFNSTDNFDIPRAPLDEVINYIDAELLSVSKELRQEPIKDDQYNAWPTKGVALAVRAKLWLYAASPLFNGEYREALQVMTPYGINGEMQHMYPNANPTKWEKAKSAAEDFIDYANENNRYVLYSTGNPTDDVYDMFQKYTDEIIWATSNNNWGGMDGDSFDRRITPRSEQNGLGSTAVYQELIDDFYMKDGLPINKTNFLPESPLYSEEGFTTVNGTPIFNMWVNREPRFYNTVFYAGRKWHITNNEIQFYNGSPNDKSGQHAKTGYLLYKRFNRTVHKRNPGVTSKFRPSIIFRLAEFYLVYAEALNEVDPSNPNVLLYINKVRERAGLPKLEVLNPTIKGNKDLQREAIIRERRIELATEGQRYFDIRRWMIADKPAAMQNKDMHGMNMEGGKDEFFQRAKIHRNVFNRKMYLFPIPYWEMRKTAGAVVQNPGWN